MELPVLANLTVSDWTFVLATILVLVVLAFLIAFYFWDRQQQRHQAIEHTQDNLEVLKEIVDSLKSMKRGLSSIKRKLDGRDQYAQRELSEAKRLILDVETRLAGHVNNAEHRLTGQVVETKEIVRDTRSQITNIHGGQNNLGSNSIGGGQTQH